MAFFDWVNNLDIRFFNVLNGTHSAMADGFWWAVTDTMSWLPFFLILIYVIIANKGRESILIIVSIAITVLLADQLSGLIKDLVGRLRPSHNPLLMYDIHIVNGYRGGLYSFVSSHAANTFGVAMLLSLIVKNGWFSLTMFAWAFLNGFSRIYLGVHFPFDIIAGGLLGILIGWATYKGLDFLRMKLPAFSSITTERIIGSHTRTGFKKAQLLSVVLVFLLSIFFFILLSGFVKDFMP
ncbi:phosphatase PAP2 family protein [Saccharicrinis sp. FJH2]|uniref:phosphatase PAP2 family protein n=1 Tax=unclassified Saccharicrinis TaxID=2646859 RepID=UPI0035D4F05E